MLSFSFEELEKALTELAASETQRDTVKPIMSGLRKQLQGSGDRLSIMLLDQVLAAAWLIQNEDGDLVIEEVKALFRSH